LPTQGGNYFFYAAAPIMWVELHIRKSGPLNVRVLAFFCRMISWLAAHGMSDSRGASPIAIDMPFMNPSAMAFALGTGLFHICLCIR
jgi:hypothetical protein